MGRTWLTSIRVMIKWTPYRETFVSDWKQTFLRSHLLVGLIDLSLLFLCQLQQLGLVCSLSSL